MDIRIYICIYIVSQIHELCGPSSFWGIPLKILYYEERIIHLNSDTLKLNPSAFRGIPKNRGVRHKRGGRMERIKRACT